MWLPSFKLKRTRRVRIRRGGFSDLAAIAQIQGTSHFGAHWEPSTYLDYDLRIAEVQHRIAGFMVSRNIANDEVEILNIAVDPLMRRKGVATALIESIEAPIVFLEVRVSNSVAIQVYEKLGFVDVGRRKEYYEAPVEDAIVMRRVK